MVECPKCRNRLDYLVCPDCNIRICDWCEQREATWRGVFLFGAVGFLCDLCKEKAEKDDPERRKE